MDARRRGWGTEDGCFFFRRRAVFCRERSRPALRVFALFLVSSACDPPTCPPGYVLLAGRCQPAFDADTRDAPSPDARCAEIDGFADRDGDGYGDPRSPRVACTGVARTGDDCDDSNPSVRPGGVEVCNEVDDDCDGAVDEGIQRFLGKPIVVAEAESFTDLAIARMGDAFGVVYESAMMGGRGLWFRRLGSAGALLGDPQPVLGPRIRPPRILAVHGIDADRASLWAAASHTMFEDDATVLALALEGGRVEQSVEIGAWHGGFASAVRGSDLFVFLGSSGDSTRAFRLDAVTLAIHAGPVELPVPRGRRRSLFYAGWGDVWWLEDVSGPDFEVRRLSPDLSYSDPTTLAREGADVVLSVVERNDVIAVYRVGVGSREVLRISLDPVGIRDAVLLPAMAEIGRATAGPALAASFAGVDVVVALPTAMSGQLRLVSASRSGSSTVALADVAEAEISLVRVARVSATVGAVVYVASRTSGPASGATIEMWRIGCE